MEGGGGGVGALKYTSVRPCRLAPFWDGMFFLEGLLVIVKSWESTSFTETLRFMTFSTVY